MSAALSVAACQGLDARADVRLVDSVLERLLVETPVAAVTKAAGACATGEVLRKQLTLRGHQRSDP